VNTSYFVDMGNTRWKYLNKDDSESGIKQHLYQEDPVTGMIKVLDGLDLPAHFVISSVRSGSLNQGLQAYLQEQGCTVRWITWRDCIEINTAYENPAALGIDRYLNMVAALRLYQPPLIIVDAGTAVTADALDNSGAHLGGCIFPGKRLLMQALNQQTDKIHVEDVRGNDTIFARSTSAGVAAGVSYGLTAAIKSMIENMKKELGKNTTVLFTGGDARWLADAIRDFETKVDLTLLFSGLRFLDG